MADVDIRNTLGLPPDAPNVVVERRLAELKELAQKNIPAPEGFAVTAENHESVVYEGYMKGTLFTSDLTRLTKGFKGQDIEMLQLNHHDKNHLRIQVRVRKGA